MPLKKMENFQSYFAADFLDSVHLAHSLPWYFLFDFPLSVLCLSHARDCIRAGYNSVRRGTVGIFSGENECISFL